MTRAETPPGVNHDERCCMTGNPPGMGPHPDCPGYPYWPDEHGDSRAPSETIRRGNAPQLDSAEVARLLEGAQARRGDDLRPDSRAEIAARLHAIKTNNPQVTRPWPYDGPEGRARLTGSLDTGGSFTGDDDDDDYDRQSTTACCPRQTIPDSCSCPDGCQCLCADCDCPRCPDCGRSSCNGRDCYWPDEAGLR